MNKEVSADAVVIPLTLLLERIIKGREGQSVLAWLYARVESSFPSWQSVPEFLIRGNHFSSEGTTLQERQKSEEREKRSWAVGRGGRLGEGPGAEHQPDCAGRTSRSLLTEQGGQLGKPQHQGSGLHGAAPLHLLHESNANLTWQDAFWASGFLLVNWKHPQNYLSSLVPLSFQKFRGKHIMSAMYKSHF